MTEHTEHVFDAIFGRRSIRSYIQGREVEREKIVTLLEAAMAAPSACNIQPWEFIVVTDTARVAAVRESLAEFGNYNAPAIIVVCGYADFIPWGDDYGIVDCCAATENMLIAATAMGLGTVWVGGFDIPSLRALLDIPESVTPVSVVYLGYPAETHEPRTKYCEDAVYWQKYAPERERHPRPGNLIYRDPE